MLLQMKQKIKVADRRIEQLLAYRLKIVKIQSEQASTKLRLGGDLVDLLESAARYDNEVLGAMVRPGAMRAGLGLRTYRSVKRATKPIARRVYLIIRSAKKRLLK